MGVGGGEEGRGEKDRRGGEGMEESASGTGTGRQARAGTGTPSTLQALAATQMVRARLSSAGMG